MVGPLNDMLTAPVGSEHLRVTLCERDTKNGRHTDAAVAGTV